MRRPLIIFSWVCCFYVALAVPAVRPERHIHRRSFPVDTGKVVEELDSGFRVPQHLHSPGLVFPDSYRGFKLTPWLIRSSKIAAGGQDEKWKQPGPELDKPEHSSSIRNENIEFAQTNHKTNPETKADGYHSEKPKNLFSDNSLFGRLRTILKSWIQSFKNRWRKPAKAQDESKLVEENKKPVVENKKPVVVEKPETTTPPPPSPEIPKGPTAKAGTLHHWYLSSPSSLARFARFLRRYFAWEKPIPQKGPIKPKAPEPKPEPDPKVKSPEPPKAEETVQNQDPRTEPAPKSTDPGAPSSSGETSKVNVWKDQKDLNCRNRFHSAILSRPVFSIIVPLKSGSHPCLYIYLRISLITLEAFSVCSASMFTS